MLQDRNGQRERTSRCRSRQLLNSDRRDSLTVGRVPLQPPTLSVIIPTLDESDHIGRTVVAALSLSPEVVVVDGGSSDDTVEIALRSGAQVVCAERGRGLQLHEGAKTATGDILLFLHADTHLPQGAREKIIEALSDSKVVGGNFYNRFEPAVLSAQIFTLLSDSRQRILGTFYGDSGLFVRADVYRSIGGFRPLPLFEDYDLAKRLKKTGRMAYLRDVHAVTSARRFQGRPFRTLATWILLQGMYSVGVPEGKLARIYRQIR